MDGKTLELGRCVGFAEDAIAVKCFASLNIGFLLNKCKVL